MIMLLYLLSQSLKRVCQDAHCWKILFVKFCNRDCCTFAFLRDLLDAEMDKLGNIFVEIKIPSEQAVKCIQGSQH